MSLRSWVSRLSGWTPLGKVVEVSIENSRNQQLCGKKLLATIILVSDDGSANLAISNPELLTTRRIDVHVRHNGYDFFHLRYGAIAVDLSCPTSEKISGKTDTRFASGMLKLVTHQGVQQQ